MFILEPILAYDREVTIHTPKVTEGSFTHGKIPDQIRHNCRDNNLKQWDDFQQVRHGVSAHSTHLRERGGYDGETGKETLRINGALEIGISIDRCPTVGLGYLNLASLDPDEWIGKEKNGILVLSRVSEILFRLHDLQLTKMSN
jgi:hypothetical protein